MRRITAWVGGVAGGIAAYRLFRRRPQTAPEPASPESDDRAEELRAKLAESRVAEPAGETVVDEPSRGEDVVEPDAEEPAAEQGEAESPDERRRRVHEEGRAALDEMKPE